MVVDRDSAAATTPPVAGARPLRELAAGDPAALRLLDGIWLVPAERLLEATHGIVITNEGHGYDAERGELWFAGETAEAVLLEMDARRRALADEADELAAAPRPRPMPPPRPLGGRRRRGGVRRGRASARAERRSGRARALVELTAPSRTARACPRDRRAAGGAARSPSHDGRRAGGRARSELRRLSTLEADAARDAADAVARAQAAEVVVARLGGSVDDLPPAEQASREALLAEAASLLTLSEAAAAEARAAADRARDADAALLERAPRRSALDSDMLDRLLDAVGGLGAGLERAAGSSQPASRLRCAPASTPGAERSARLGEELRRLGAAEVEVRQRADEATERATAIQVELARLDAEAEEAQRRFDEAGADEPAEGDDRNELAVASERLDARREALGKVNPLAKEEYEEEKERLEELAPQRQDLEASLAEIAKLRDELAETVQRRFTETFETVARNFEEVAATLFPGGEGRLRLVEPGEDAEGNELEAGVEVELRPAGKRITRLTLLSGGEKALGAISFLFALFLAKPCPFYLLDEVEAALDDANVTRFVELLRRYSDRAQFIVITHQKRTMEAADVLYGVTMGGDGVSQVVSRRLPQHDRAAAIAYGRRAAAQVGGSRTG